MLIKQVVQENVAFAIIIIFYDMSMKTISINNLAIVYSKGNAYRIHFWNMSKDDAINIMHNSNLVDKKGVL